VTRAAHQRVRGAHLASIIRVLPFVELFLLEPLHINLGPELERRDAAYSIVGCVEGVRVDGRLFENFHFAGARASHLRPL